MSIKFKKLCPEAIIPKRATEGSAGLDLSACFAGDLHPWIEIKPGESAMIHTGLAVEIPVGYVGLLFGRSGLGCKEHLRPSNCVGVFDSDYRGEIMVSLYNDSNVVKKVVDSSRIAQLVIVSCLSLDAEEVEELSDTNRGEGGFGSTGYGIM